MAKRDQPFKRLITLIGREFAAWVLNMDVRSVKLLSSEHTAIPAPIPSDLLFEVTLADGRTGLMPVEITYETQRRRGAEMQRCRDAKRKAGQSGFIWVHLW
jgi:hypothetical protein